MKKPTMILRHMNLPSLSGVLACFLAAAVFGYYLHLLNVAVDLKILVPSFGSLAAVTSGLWSLYRWADNFLEEFRSDVEKAHQDLDGRVARLDARVQILLDEPRFSEGIARRILEEIDLTSS